MKIVISPKKMYLKCVITFYYLDKEKRRKKIKQGSIYEDLGIENGKRKLKRIDRETIKPVIYLDKNEDIKKHFKFL